MGSPALASPELAPQNHRRPRPAPGAATGLWRTTAAIAACKVTANAAVAAVVLVTARGLGPTGRGVLVLLLTLASFTLLVCSAGLNTSGRIHLVGPDAVDPAAYLGLSTTLTAAQLAVCGLLGTVLLPLVDVELSLAQDVLFALLGASLLLPFLLNAAINAFGFTTRAAVVDASGSIAQLLFVVVLAVRGVDSVSPYVGALIAGNVVQVVVSLAALRRAGIPLGLRYDKQAWATLVRTGTPGIAMDVSQVLTFRSDRYILGLFLDPAAVGVYSVAATAPELLRLPALALSQPIFHRLASGAARIGDFARTRVLALGMTAVLAVATFLAAPWVIQTLFGAEYAAAVTPLRIMLLAEFGITLFYIDGSLLAAGQRRLGAASRASFAGLVVATIANLVLIPTFGLAGAAWGSVAAYSVVGIVAHLLLRRGMTSEQSTDEPAAAPAEIDDAVK